MKSRRVRWAGHVDVWGKEEVHAGIWWGNLRGREYLETQA
jgi:hypothetical protein